MTKTLEMGKTQTELGMRILWDAPIEMDDGVILRADVFLSEPESEYPIIMTFASVKRDGRNLKCQLSV